MAAESGRPHRKLEVWQKSMALVRRIYELTKEFPKEETYGLSSQMQRSAVSIARKSKAEFLQFLSIAQGSLSELDTQLEVVYMHGYVDEKKQKEKLAEITSIFKMLSRLIRSLKQ